MTTCIYHGNCADGFGAAWVVRKAMSDIVDLHFYPGKYQTTPPDVTDEHVIMVDFSYKRPVLIDMAKKAKSILIIDHHKTAEADLVDLPPNVITIFDMNHSGAMLTWLHYFLDDTPPPLLLHIEDRDLWRFHLRNTRQIQANLFSYPYDFSVWDRLMKMTEEDLVVFARDGEAIERKHFKDIDELLNVTTRFMQIGGIIVPTANLPYTLSSDAGHKLAEAFPFSACYYDTPEGRVFSLRSRIDGYDVSEIAKIYGGGGHKHAAGFTVSYEKALEFEIIEAS